MVRHDAISLHSGTNEAAFESFMKDELIPFFSEHYKGPTRSSIADLKGQALLEGDPRHRPLSVDNDLGWRPGSDSRRFL